MKTLEYTFDTTIEFSDEVREHSFVLRCQPRRDEGIVVVKSELEIEPDIRFTRQRDSFGNELAVGWPRPTMRYAHGRRSPASCAKHSMWNPKRDSPSSNDSDR